MCVPPAFDRSPHPHSACVPNGNPTNNCAPSVAIARAVGRPPRFSAPLHAPVPRVPPEPSRALDSRTRPEPPPCRLDRSPPVRPPSRRRRRERLAEHSEHLERQHADAFGPASSDDVDHPDAEPFEDANDEPIEPIEPIESSPRVRSKGPKGRRSTPTEPAPPTPEGQRLVDLVRAEAGRDASPSQRRVDALLRAEDESRPFAPARITDRDATRTAAARVGGTAGFKKPTRLASSATESSSRGGFLNFGSFWRRTPEDRSPEVTKKPSRTLTSAEKARLFSRLHADPSKAVADPDPEETFRPKISGKSRRIGARVHARENSGMRRVDFLLHKGTEDIRDKNERWRAYDDAPPDSAAARTIDPKEYFIDEGSGRVGRPGDKVARALRAARDEAEAAAHAFEPRLNPASRALASSRDGSGSGSAARRFYARGLEWIERRKRGVEAATRARKDEEERACTFRPRLVSAVPAFVREIAAKMRRGRLGPGADAAAAETAMASAANRSAGWLAPAPHYAKSPLWDEDANDRGDDDAREERDDDDEGAVVVGDVRLPSAPAEHPATRRASKHVPIKSATSHSDFATAGSPRRTGSRTRGSPNARSRNSLLVARTRTRRGSAATETISRGRNRRRTRIISSVCIWSARSAPGSRRARNETRCADTTGADGAIASPNRWGPRSACAPPERSGPCAGRTQPRRPRASPTRCPTCVWAVWAARRGGTRDTTPPSRAAVRDARWARRDGATPRGRTRRMSPTRARRRGRASRGDWANSSTSTTRGDGRIRSEPCVMNIE